MTRVDAGSGADGNGSVPNRVPLQNATALSRGVLSAEPLLSEAAQDFHWLGVNIPCRTACPAGTDIPG
ncbi:MAG: hypothetical protein KIT73_19395, partial [Burkholderiales bacterium]|nr:hypothetical protein [Burkholderiales bacterium]